MGRTATVVASLIGIGLLLYGVRAVTRPKLTHFKPAEFGPWWPLMSRDLLLKLDTFRERWGAPVQLSPAEGGIGREDHSNSQHNALKWGEVRAVDIMPYGMDTPAMRQLAVRIAEEVGFTGIGIYPNWKPRPGLHVDVREPSSPGHVAMWSGVIENGTQVYASIERGLA